MSSPGANTIAFMQAGGTNSFFYVSVEGLDILVFLNADLPV